MTLRLTSRGKTPQEWVADSDDVRPLTGAAGARLHESDTGDDYIWDGERWELVDPGPDNPDVRQLLTGILREVRKLNVQVSLMTDTTVGNEDVA